MIRLLRELPYLDEDSAYVFPSLRDSSPEGIVCAGGNLSPGLLLSAYRQGIFPWYEEDSPILWWSPDPRFVVLAETFHVSASARRLLRRQDFSLSLDGAFGQVIKACAQAKRQGQDGTWIVPDMIEAYTRLFELGYAHSVEVRRGGTLVGGLYGLSLGGAFFGESMFSVEKSASHVAFLAFAMTLFENGFILIDSQVHSDYVAGMGGVDIPRGVYMQILQAALGRPQRRGSWSAAFPGFPSSRGMAAVLGAGKARARGREAGRGA